MTPYKIVEVEWVDSFSRGGWQPEAMYRQEIDARAVPLIRSVGYLLKRDSEATTLVQSASESGNLNDTISIPSGCIRRVRTIRKASKK